MTVTYKSFLTKHGKTNERKLKAVIERIDAHLNGGTTSLLYSFNDLDNTPPPELVVAVNAYYKALGWGGVVLKVNEAYVRYVVLPPEDEPDADTLETQVDSLLNPPTKTQLEAIAEAFAQNFVDIAMGKK